MEGQLVDKNNKGISRKKIQIALPPQQGLSVAEATVFEVLGNEKKSKTVVTDDKGSFVESFDLVYHASIFIVPPLGPIPKEAPEPFYFLGVDSTCKKTWGILARTDNPEVRLFDWDSEEFVKYKESEKPEITVQSIRCKGKCEQEVTTKVKVTWDEKISCLGYHPADPNRKRGIAKRGLYLSYADLFSNFIGIGLSRRFTALGVLRLDLPLGFSGKSYGVGLLGIFTFIKIWRIGLNLGLGPELLLVRTSDGLNSNYQKDVHGMKSRGQVSLEYSLKRGFYSESGFVRTALGLGEFDDRFFFRIGWFF
ncbi:MAG: hypothetical protein AB7F43_01495 [Bacteriovoracia bacterium]